MSRQIDAAMFEPFFLALHGYPPFPWQCRLVKQVCETGALPALLDLPTGTGKTSLIEIALFHLAHDLTSGNARSAPLRIAWVVDRRLVVDEAFERAKEIAEKLASANTGVLKEVADALRSLAGDGAPPLIAQRLRGGMPLEADWARTPTQPTVISSTVDQVGSRLLFRGYGVTDRMKPIHAGLLGEDALIVLDEVHLAEPFRQTLASIGHKRAETAARTPWRFVQLSATPREGDSDTNTFRLDQEDQSNPVLAPRLSRPKPTTLLSLGRVQYESRKHVEAFVEEALRRIDVGNPDLPKNILVVVNRVALARDIYDAVRNDRIFRAALPESYRENVTLLIGRNREVCKQRIRDLIVTRCGSDVGEKRPREPGPFIVVATQSVEAGADLDFDVLITQIAPLDVLRQRFGRLNRLGRPIQAEAVIVAVDAEIAASAKPDVIYDEALRETWRWLESKGDLDFAAAALGAPADELGALRGPALDAPVLMPDHVHALSRTNPRLPWSPDPALYLHGKTEMEAEVNIVWRADLSGADREVVEEVLSLVPPRSGESIAVPIGVARKWLRGQRAEGELADTDASNDAGDAGQRAETTDVRIRAWRWLGRDRRVEPVRRIYDAHPGDTILVDSARGGCDALGWSPRSTFAADVADQAALPYARRSYAVRLHQQLLEQAAEAEGVPGETVSWRDVSTAIDDCGEDAGALLDTLIGTDGASGLPLPAETRRQLLALRDATKGKPSLEFAYDREEPGPQEDGVLRSKGRRGVILVARSGLRESGIRTLTGLPPLAREEAAEASTGDDAVAAEGPRVDGQRLKEHSEWVRDLASSAARRLGLPSTLVGDVALAAYLHDVGKSDLRFQCYLCGDPWNQGGEIRAKSGQRRSGRDDRKALGASGLPAHWRHEALSVRIARAHASFAGAHDPELVLWLIGTHHGYGRPMFPHEEPRDEEPGQRYYGFEPHLALALAMELDPSPGPQRIDFRLTVMTERGLANVNWQTMFRRLEGRYGVWGLAWLEAIVRLADHRASEAAEKAQHSEVSA